MDLVTVLNSPDFRKTSDPYHKRYKCISCGEQKYKLYIHFQKKVFICHKCGISGSIHGQIQTSVDHFDRKVEDFRNGNATHRPSISSSIELPEGFKRIRESSGLPYSYLSKRGLSRDEIKDYGMGYCPEGRYEGRIIIPIYRDGELVYFIGRSFSGRIPKYLNVGKGRNKVIFKTFTNPVSSCIIVEGVFTAIYVSRLLPAIATLGKIISETQCEQISKWCKKVYVVLDSNARKECIQATCKLAHYISAVPIFINKPAPDSYSLEELERIITNGSRNHSNPS